MSTSAPLVYPESPSRTCKYPGGCGRPAVWCAEALSWGDVPLCDEHYEAMIALAQKNNPDMDPDRVRSLMERAAYPIQRESKDAPTQAQEPR